MFGSPTQVMAKWAKKNHKYTQDMKIYILIIYKMSFILIRYVHFSQDICGTKVSELKRCFIHLNQKDLEEKNSKSSEVTKKSYPKIKPWTTKIIRRNLSSTAILMPTAPSFPAR